jgi:hypothetical protein
MKPFQLLNVKQGEMQSDDDFDFILAFANSFPPQSNTSKPLWDPSDPDNPENERLKPDLAPCRISAGSLSITLPPTSARAQEVVAGIARLLELQPSIVECLAVGIQLYTIRFDDWASDYVMVPPGWDWGWLMTCDRLLAADIADQWRGAGYTFTTLPGVEVSDSFGVTGLSVGWLNASASTKTAERYTICPDLRIPECRTWLLERHAAILREHGLTCCNLDGKSGRFVEAAPIENTPATPLDNGLWLPSPYPGESYQQANADLVREAGEIHGAERVSWSNSGTMTPREAEAAGCPFYVSTRDGGLKQWADDAAKRGETWAADCYGSDETKWTREILEARGFRERYM